MKKKISLKWKIALILTVAGTGMVAMLVLFQTKLLQPMYEHNKTDAVVEAADEINAYLQSNDYETVMNIAAQNDLCVRVIRSDGDEIAAGSMGCVLYRMNSAEVLDKILRAQENDGSLLEIGTPSAYGVPEKNGQFQTITYTKLYHSAASDDVVMVNGNISPVDATVETLKMQLGYIGMIIIILMILLSYFLYRLIAKPLIDIKSAAESLPEGKYEIKDNTNKYREAEELNETLKQAALDIRKADQAKRDLIGNVSHDLRTPLTMISGYGEMMRDLPGENNPENLQVIIDESQRLTYLVNDLLDLSKLESHRIVLKKTEFNLDEVLQDELRKYDVYKINDGFDIVYHSEGSSMVYADEERIRQVFNNFMTNAINYSGNGRKIEVGLENKGNQVYVYVKDHGEGISEDKLKDIWDRYYKVDRTHVRFTNGSGIGLSIVKELLDLHDVPYGVTSKLNEGSTFWFELPHPEKETDQA